MKHLLVRLLVLSLGGMIIFSVGRSIVALYQASHRLTREQTVVNNLEVQNAWLKEQIAIAQTAEYIEKIARDQLALAQDNDVTLVLPRSQGVATESAWIKHPQGNWQRWYTLFFQ